MKITLLTEEELKELVMKDSQQVLNEMAEPLKKYIKRIEKNNIFQLK